MCCTWLSDQIQSLHIMRKYWHRFCLYWNRRRSCHWNVRKVWFYLTCEVIEMMEAESKVIVNWSYDVQIVKGSSDKYNLNKDYVKVLDKWLWSSIGTIVTGFTKATITSTSGECTQFYAHSCFQGQQWYDWAHVHFQEMNNQTEEIENHYPSKILDFLDIEGKCEAVIQCSVKLLLWSVGKIFFLLSWNWEQISTFRLFWYL